MFSYPTLSKNLWQSLNARLVTRPNGHGCKVVGVTNGCIAVQLGLALRRFFWQNTLSHDFGCGVSILGTNFGLFFLKWPGLEDHFTVSKNNLIFLKMIFLLEYWISREQPLLITFFDTLGCQINESTGLAYFASNMFIEQYFLEFH